MKVLKKILKWFFIILFLLIVVFFVSRSFIKFFIYYNSTSSNRISEIRKVSLGGKVQKILIEGKKDDNPVLLILHGGPEIPILFGNGYRGYHEKLVDNFVVVEWDQYGCGNNRGDYKDLSLTDYVEMSKDLVKYIKKEFPSNDIYLLGISSGTVLGAYVINELPAYIAKYISYGSLINLEVSYKYYVSELEKMDLNKNDRNEIESIKDSYSYDNLLQLRDIAKKYDYYFQGENKIDKSMNKAIIRLLYSPDYSLMDFIGILKNDVTSSKLFKEINEVDVWDKLEDSIVPIYFIQGKYDYTTPPYVIEGLAKKDTNSYYELESSGHMLVKKDIDLMIDYIVDLKK